MSKQAHQQLPHAADCLAQQRLLVSSFDGAGKPTVVNARASGGRLIHSIHDDMALCGFSPKNDSVGRGRWRGSPWYVTDSKVTCTGCVKALAKEAA
jgi:hypothetical protein